MAAEQARHDSKAESNRKTGVVSRKVTKLWQIAGLNLRVEMTAKSSTICLYKNGFSGFSALREVFTQMGFLQGGNSGR